MWLRLMRRLRRLKRRLMLLLFCRFSLLVLSPFLPIGAAVFAPMALAGTKAQGNAGEVRGS